MSARTSWKRPSFSRTLATAGAPAPPSPGTRAGCGAPFRPPGARALRLLRLAEERHRADVRAIDLRVAHEEVAVDPERREALPGRGVGARRELRTLHRDAALGGHRVRLELAVWPARAVERGLR